MSKRPIWHKQPEEGTAQYAAFCLYRDAGEDRSLARVAATAVAARSPRSHHQRRYLTHPQPEVYLRSIVRCWKRWSKRFSWVSRVEAYDDHLAEVAQARSFEAALATRQAEIEEQERQKRLRLDETRAARGVVRGVLHRTLTLIQERALDRATISELLPQVPRLVQALDVAQKAERAELGQACGAEEAHDPGYEEEVHELAREVLAETKRMRHGQE